MALHLRALVTLLEDSDSIPSTNIAAYKQTPRDPMPYTGLYGHLAPTWHIKHVCRQNFHIHKSYTIFYDVIWHVGNKQEREGDGLTPAFSLFSPHMFIYLNTWSPGIGTVCKDWELSVGVGFEISLSCSLCLHATMFPTMMIMD